MKTQEELEDDRMDTKAKVIRLLRRMGINGGYLGFYYTASAVAKIVENKGKIYQCKWIYNEVAKEYQTTPFCVERNIRTLIDVIWNEGNRELLQKIMYYPKDAKPKNVQFIDGLAAHIIEEEETGCSILDFVV